ncbi:MAG TPA: hypothetical protein VKY36_03825 [Moheibacter sp.]|nr:hypothetical protein [Moheibacter sp.]
MISTSQKLTQMQLELLKSFRFVTDEEQLKEVKSLLNFYFRQKLDEAINQIEKEKNYNASIYQKWLEINK